MKQALVAGAALLLSVPAGADSKPDPQQVAAEAYQAGRYEEALAALEEAYATNPAPELDESLGQVYVKLGRCPEAISSYELYLATKPPADRAALANQAIDACKKSQPKFKDSGDLDDGEAPPNMGTPTVAPTVTMTQTDDDWYKDKLGLALASAGTAVTVIGVILYSHARGIAKDAEKAATYGESASLYDDARGQRTISLVLVGAGVVATGFGVWRLLSERDHEGRVAIVPAPAGGFVTFSGGF